MTEEMWQAIIHNDCSADGKFFYGVATTGIFCRPSCRSKNPSRANVRLFADPEAAMAAGFRPCKRCRPERREQPDAEWVGQIVREIEAHYREPLTLGALADRLHASPYHMHRTFKKLTGVTPAEYMLRTRISAAEAMLLDSAAPVTEIAQRAGFANAAYFSAVFHRRKGCTPSDFRASRRDGVRVGAWDGSWRG